LIGYGWRRVTNFMGIDNPIHLIFLAGVALLVLGPKRLPEVARSLGKGIREFREAMSDGSVGGFVHAHEDSPSAGGPPSPPPDAEVVADDGSARPAGPEGVAGGGAIQDAGPRSAAAAGLVQDAGTGVAVGGDAAHGAVSGDVAAVGEAPVQVDPAEPVRSGDAPDRRSL
jgi:TatA/E family protein of Tat protein translocase